MHKTRAQIVILAILSMAGCGDPPQASTSHSDLTPDQARAIAKEANI